jgi:hypothetical protein
MALLIVIILVLLIIYIIKKNERIDIVSSADQQAFEGMRFSTQEFYALTETLIKEKEIPSLTLCRVEHQVGGLFSGKRQYLRVKYKEYFFDICAAPFAMDFFVSWRQGQLQQIKVAKRRYKTFYEQDTESMFKASVKLCLERAIQQITEAKGVRQIPELV